MLISDYRWSERERERERELERREGNCHGFCAASILIHSCIWFSQKYTALWLSYFASLFRISRAAVPTEVVGTALGGFGGTCNLMYMTPFLRKLPNLSTRPTTTCINQSKNISFNWRKTVTCDSFDKNDDQCYIKTDTPKQNSKSKRNIIEKRKNYFRKPKRKSI